MKHKTFGSLPPPPPRPERLQAPMPPRLCAEISRLLRARMHREESGIMTQSTARIVMAHLAASGGMPQLEIVRVTRLKPPTVSVLLRRMEEEGYITRQADENDRRAIHVALTEKGKAFDRDCLSRMLTNDERAMRGFSEEETATLKAFLLRMRDNLLEE